MKSDKLKKLPPRPELLAALYGLYLISSLLRPVIGGDVGVLFYYLGICFGLWITLIVFNCIFLYRLWVLAQGSYFQARKPTPGEAVRFLFIPFFNLYWIFIARRNCARHLNHLAGNEVVSVPLVTAECILAVILTFGMFAIKGINTNFNVT